MENATKALLIAAAVLVSIVLIAMGIVLLRSSSGVSEDVDEVGTAISIGAKDARRSMFKGEHYSKENIHATSAPEDVAVAPTGHLFADLGFYEGELPTDMFGGARELNDSDYYEEDVLVNGYVLNGWKQANTWYDLNGEVIMTIPAEGETADFVQNMKDKWIPQQLKQKNLTKVLGIKDTKELFSAVKKKIGNKYEDMRIDAGPTLRFIPYDKRGRISGISKENKIVGLIYIVMPSAGE